MRFKQLIVIILTALMVLTTAVPTFAAESVGEGPVLESESTKLEEETAESENNATDNVKDTDKEDVETQEIQEEKSDEPTTSEKITEDLTEATEKAKSPAIKLANDEERSTEGEAYAVLEDDGDLILFRSNETYTNNTTGTFNDILGNTYTGRVFADIENGGEYQNNAKWYDYAQSVKTMRVADGQLIQPKNCCSWFIGCSAMTTCDLEGLDTSNATSITGMFFGCSSLTNLDLSMLDVNNVTNICASNIMNGKGLFQGCRNLTTLILPHFQFENIKDMGYMFAGCSSLTSLDVSNFDTSNVTSMCYMFSDCCNLTSLDVSGFDTSNVKDMSHMFEKCRDLTSLDVSNFDTSKVVRMDNMFAYCNSLISFDVSNFSTSNVTSMFNMFRECHALTSIDVNFDTAKVTDMACMFEGCRNLINLDVSNFDTSNVINMSYMFDSCYKLTSIDVNGFDTSKVKNMSYMFSNCSSISNLDLSKFDTSNVTNMRSMFDSCSSMTELDVRGFNTAKVSDMGAMFNHCDYLGMIALGTDSLFDKGVYNIAFSNNQLTRIRLLSGTVSNEPTIDTLPEYDGAYPGWYEANVAYAVFDSSAKSLTFYRDKATHHLNGDSEGTKTYYRNFENEYFLSDFTVPWAYKNRSIVSVSFKDVIKPISTDNWFKNCTKLTSCNLQNLDTSKTTDMGAMFYNCSSIEELDLSMLDTSKVELFTNHSAATPTGMFEGCSSLKHLDVSNFDTSNATVMDSMFSRCGSLTHLDLLNFDTSNVILMKDMFNYCRSLESLDLSNFDTSKVVNMHGMFAACINLTNLDISNFDTSNVTDMSSMFSSCNSLTNLNLSNFNTSKVTNMSYMFAYCNAATNINVSNFDTSIVKDMQYMFYDCRSLSSLDLSNFDALSVGNMYYMFERCNALNKIDIGEKFSFKGFSIGSPKYRALLPGDKWVRKSTEDVYASTELRDTYDGSVMADTYCKIINIKFNANGGQSEEANIESYISGTIKEELPSATRKGYDFLGWFTEPDGGNEIHQGDEVTQAEYYAYWKPHKYTLILDPNGGFGIPIPVVLDYNQDYIPGEPFTNENYVFDGWNTRRNGSGEAFDKFDAISMIEAEDGAVVTLYAQWTQTNYTVTFNSMGGSEVPSRIVKNGKQLGRLYTPVKEGYTFGGWYTTETGGSSVSESIVINEDKTFYARWNKNPTVTFNANGGTVSETERVVLYNKAIGELPIPSKENYTFDGWYTAETGGSKITASKTVKVDTTFYAHWKIRLNFDPNGGKITEDINNAWTDSPETYTAVALAEAIKDGYEFDGWYTAPAGGTKVNIGDTIDLTSGSTVYAHWKASETVTVTFDSNGGSTCKPQTRYKGQEIGTLPVPTRSGYVFEGWFASPQPTRTLDGNTRITEDTIIEEDVTLYARWNTSHVLTFNDNEYNLTLTRTVPDGGTLNTLPGMRRTQYILEGWYPNADGTGERLTTDTVITENATYYAKWVPEMYDKTSDDIAYSYSATWSNASNDNVDNINNNLDFHPTDNQRQTASLHIRFEMNEAVDTVVPVGAVRITIPKSVFKNWSGQVADTNNISSNLPKYPNKRNGMLFSYMEEDDSYILINNTELAGGAGVDATFSYYVYPNQVPGGAMDYDGNYVDGYDYYHDTFPITFAVDSDLDGTDETNDSIDLSLEMHTRVRSSQSKSCTTVKYVWDTSWGEKPVDADEYFYIVWNVSESILSTTNQPYRYSISEDTVHDGTVIVLPSMSSEQGTGKSTRISGDYSRTVVTKHPKSLLAELDENGIVFHNEAIVTEHWKSGYETPHLVKAETILYGRQYPTGEWDKHYYGWSSSSNVRNGGQEDVLDDSREVYIPYELIYDGGSNGQPITWDDETKTYNAPERTIMMRDGVQGDLMYSSGRTQQKYVWEPKTGNSALGDNDYYIKSLDIYIDEFDVQQNNGLWTDRIAHSDKSLYQPSEVWVRLKGEDEFIKYQDLPANTISLTLPNNTVGFEVRHKTKFYSTKYRIVAHMYLKPTNRVKNFVRNDVEVNATSIIKNKAICHIWNGDDEEHPFFVVTNYKNDTSSAFKDLWELNVSTTNLQVRKYTSPETSTVFDVERGTQDTPVLIVGRNYNNSSRAKRLESGVFYDLLPMGTTVDESTLFGVVNTSNGSVASSVSLSSYNSKKSQAIDKNYYSVEFIDNWEGSGRTMMVINVGLPEKIKACSIEFYYMLHNTYENVVDRGTTVENDVAFANISENKTPYNGTKTDARSVIKEQQFYESIDRKYGDTVAFAQASTHYIPVDAFSWGYYKTVMTGSSYESEGYTVPNNEYTYRLTYSQSEYSKSDKIVFFDILEGGTETHPSQWYGELKNVNTLAAADMISANNANAKCAPVVYYSTKARDAFTGNDWDVDNASTWTTVKPANNADITAIAVDCSKASDGSDFVMKGKSAMNIYITMKAPGDAENISKSTTNEGVHLARKYTTPEPEGEPTFEYSDATVTIHDTSEEFLKSSAPVTGTQEQPEGVIYGDVINYTLAYTNNDENITYKDVILEDEIPEGLYVEKKNIKVYIADESNSVKVNNSARVTMQSEGQDLTFTLKEVLPKETVHISIPTTVNVREGTFVNQAKKLSVNGYEKEVKSTKTYHKVIPTNLKISKKILGTNTALPGATLQLLNSSNNVVEEWTSTAEPKEFNLGADTYTLHEVTPPDGYAAAEDIRFEVDRNGNITCNTNGALDTTDGNVISMYDKSLFVNLTVGKTVTGGFGDKNKQFDFTATLSGLTPSKVYKIKKGNVEASIAASNEGTATTSFTLADGETVTIQNLPSGTKANVTEAATAYTASYTATAGATEIGSNANSSGNTALSSGEITLSVDQGDCRIDFTNNLDSLVPTGINYSSKFIIGAVIIIIATLLIKKRIKQ